MVYFMFKYQVSVTSFLAFCSATVFLILVTSACHPLYQSAPFSDLLRVQKTVWQKIYYSFSCIHPDTYNYTAPSIYDGSIQHYFGYNAFFSWTPNDFQTIFKGSADIRNSSIFAHFSIENSGFIWLYFNQSIQFR